MRVPAGRGAASGDLVLFAGCVLLSLLALALPATWAAGVTSSLRSTVLRPLVILQTRATTDRTARFNLPQIEAALDSVTRVAQDAAPINQENVDLRQLLQLAPRVALPHVSAEVLHQGTTTDDLMLLISVGTADGVARFDPVVTADGLLGEIWDADLHSSSVLTWLHPEFRAHAVTESGSVMGMVGPAQSASLQPILELNGVALRDTLDLGVRLYTSSRGGVYPRGIAIGKVVGIGHDSLSYERTYQVAPFVNPGRVSHVMVLKAERGAVFLPLPGSEKSTLPDTSKATIPAGGKQP